MVLVFAAAVLAVLLGVALFFSIRADRRSTPVVSRSNRLPLGAEAAIWSILEAVPDPRNHLALTRDLTGEVRIAGTMLDPAFRAALAARPAPADAADPAPSIPAIDVGAGGLWGTEAASVAPIADEPLDLRTFERAS